jgi:hypothetical protein
MSSSVDRDAASSIASTALRRFALQRRDDLDASRVLLFGSRARGDEQSDSDYDLIIVSPRFDGIEPMRRAVGPRQIWYRVGGHEPMDLICLTPMEFAGAVSRISLIASVLPEAIDLLPVEQSASA